MLAQPATEAKPRFLKPGVDYTTTGPIEFTVIHHPNPVNDLLRIRLEQATGEAVSISLRNAIGDRLMQRSFGRVSGTRTELLDLSTLAGGLYFLEVTVGTSVHVQRITKF